MSKKSRRARAKSRGIQVAPAVAGRPVQAPLKQAGQNMAKQQPAAVATPITAHQYDYVKTDLIHIAIIAGALLIILIVLSFMPSMKS